MVLLAWFARLLHNSPQFVFGSINLATLYSFEILQLSLAAHSSSRR